MSITISGDMIRLTERQERARFRRLLNREEKYLRKLIYSKSAGGIMGGDLEGAFSRIRTGIIPKRERKIHR
jgi:hypothetical protein